MHERHQIQRMGAVAALDTARKSVPSAEWTCEQARVLIAQLLDATGLDYDQRIEVLGGALVSEAVRPYWESGSTADEAHERLCRNDSELAEVVESVSTVLLARAEAQDDARTIIRFLEAKLQTPGRSLGG